MKETLRFYIRDFEVHSADRITLVSLWSWDKRAGYLKKVTSILLFCFLCLAGSLSAQGPTASRGALSANSIGDILSPHCGASSFSFTDPTTRALWQQILKTRFAPSPAALASRYLPLTISGVDATSNVVVNATLTNGNVISGTIMPTGPERPNTIVATDAAGNSFQGVIDATNTYGIVVSPGMYTLTGCFSVLVGPFMFPGPTVGFNDATPVDATAGDAMRNIILPDTPVIQIQGNVLGTDPSQSNSVTFVSADGNAGASVILDPSGSYGMNPFLPAALPAGSYTAALNQTSSAPLNSSTFVLGTATVAAAVPLPDFTKPTTTTLSGTVFMSDTSLAPANTLVLARQVATPPPPAAVPTCFSQPVNSGFASADPSTAAYTMELVPATYGLQAAIPLFPADPATRQSAGTVLVTAPNVGVTAPTMTVIATATANITSPPTPFGMSNMSGQVSDGMGIGIPNVDVTSSAWFDPNGWFFRSSTTDSTGQHLETVIPFNIFGIIFVPSN